MSVMDELRASYLSRLPDRVDSVRAALAAGSAGVAELRKIAHKLRGSGATYGFPAISAAAGALEDSAAAEVEPLALKLISVLENPEPEEDDLFVLVVSADPSTQTRLTDALARVNRRVQIANSGVRAKRLVASFLPALVLLDLLLPDMDGRRLLQTLRATPGLEDVPLIVLAARGNSRLREECFALGADQYFDKACDLSLLAVTVESLLNRLMQSASTTQMRVMSRLLSKEAFEDVYRRRVRPRNDRGRALLLLELGDLPAKHSDAVLHRVAGAILKRIRLGDQLARWGPTRLVLMAHETHRGGASALLRRLQSAVDADSFQTREGGVYRVSFQAGVTPLERDAPELGKVIARALANLQAEQSRVGVTAGSQEASTVQRVVLAEDDTDFASVVKYALSEGGFEVEHLETGAGVVEYALKRRVTLFLLDGNLPEVSGFEVLREIRATPLLRDVPVALLTALGGENDVVRGLELGADDYIVKPCSPKELLARVRKLVRLRSVEKQQPELGVGGISGKFTGQQLSELLQMLGANDKSGRLVVWGAKSKGQLDLVQGRVVNAAASSGRSGVEAAHEVLLADQGRFEFDPSVVAKGKHPLNLPVGPLLMEAMRRRDELGLL